MKASSVGLKSADNIRCHNDDTLPRCGMREINDKQVPLAAEDKFLIIPIKDPASLLPHVDDAEALRQAIDAAKPFLGNLVPLFDLRGIPHIYNDVEDFIYELADSGSQLLVNRALADDVDVRRLSRAHHANIMVAKGVGYKARSFDLSDVTFDGIDDANPIPRLANAMTDAVVPFESYAESSFRAPSLVTIQRELTTRRLQELIQGVFPGDLPYKVRLRDFAQSMIQFLPQFHQSLHRLADDWDPENTGSDTVRETHHYVRAALMHSFLRKLHRNSLMVEFVMSTNGNAIACTPFHSSAVHNVEIPRQSEVLVGRPGVIADKTRSLLAPEIRAFEVLLNDSGTKERHLQKFLESHPNFLTGLNYSNVYSQLVLEREDGTSLRPDFMLEPYDDTWCDILDIKLPNQAIIIGRNDRATLAAGIHEVAAQLREYAAYFEEEKHRKFVREKYGLRVYKPRLIAVVGRDMRQMSDPEIRRAMTAYDDLQVMTFDQLVKHAKGRLLI